jgi:hypothetical protein
MGHKPDFSLNRSPAVFQLCSISNSVDLEERRQKPQILPSANMLGIFGDRSGSPVAGLEHSRALTSARALRSHAPRCSCAIRIEGGWLVRRRPRDRSLALTSPGGFRREVMRCTHHVWKILSCKRMYAGCTI